MVLSYRNTVVDNIIDRLNTVVGDERWLAAVFDPAAASVQPDTVDRDPIGSSGCEALP